MLSASKLDAVTVDAMGTLVELHEPVERLGRALAERGHELPHDQVAAAFKAEVGYYLEHKLGARNTEELAALRRECSRVFLETAGVGLDPDEFSPAFLDSMVFRPLDGAVPALERLRAAGLALGCVSDWDVGLPEQLGKVGLDHLFEVVVTSADVGAPKPDPALFLGALSRLGVEPGRSVHVGDEDGDRDGARAAGIAFEPIPLSTVPERLGLR